MTGIFNFGPTMFPLFHRYMTDDIQRHFHDLRSGCVLDALTLIIENNGHDKGGYHMITAEAVIKLKKTPSRSCIQLLRDRVCVSQR